MAPPKFPEEVLEAIFYQVAYRWRKYNFCHDAVFEPCPPAHDLVAISLACRKFARIAQPVLEWQMLSHHSAQDVDEFFLNLLGDSSFGEQTECIAMSTMCSKPEMRATLATDSLQVRRALMQPYFNNKDSGIIQSLQDSEFGNSFLNSASVAYVLQTGLHMGFLLPCILEKCLNITSLKLEVSPPVDDSPSSARSPFRNLQVPWLMETWTSSSDVFWRKTMHTCGLTTKPLGHINFSSWWEIEPSYEYFKTPPLVNVQSLVTTTNCPERTIIGGGFLCSLMLRTISYSLRSLHLDPDDFYPTQDWSKYKDLSLRLDTLSIIFPGSRFARVRKWEEIEEVVEGFRKEYPEMKFKILKVARWMSRKRNAEVGVDDFDSF